MCREEMCDPANADDAKSGCKRTQDDDDGRCHDGVVRIPRHACAPCRWVAMLPAAALVHG